jgi:aminoglycoside phosphotransferase (APT) family kinase protein
MTPSPPDLAAVLNDIPGAGDWISIDFVDKGWSEDSKYHVVDSTGKGLLLRLSAIYEFEKKKAEYERIKLLAALGIRMSMPLDFGTCGDHVYMLLTWIDGEEASTALERMNPTAQYDAGYEAGLFLQRIHSVEAGRDSQPWDARYRAKIARAIDGYKKCGVEITGDDRIIDFINTNEHRLRGRKTTLQHGDYHVGNFIITEHNQVGIIDFNRGGDGDPWEEYNRYVFTWRTSVPFANGQIHGYFDGDVPDEFFDLMGLYSATNTLGAIPWAIPFGKADVARMIENCGLVYDAYDRFECVVPKWYEPPRR